MKDGVGSDNVISVTLNFTHTAKNAKNVLCVCARVAHVSTVAIDLSVIACIYTPFSQGMNFTAAMTAMAVVAPRSGRYAPHIILRPTATMAFVPLTLLNSRSCFKSIRTVVWFLNCIMLRSQRTRCEYLHCSNRWSFTAAVP